MDDDVTSGDAVKFGEIINILKNLECFASTVEEVDLFNNLQNILITNAAILALSGAASLYALTSTCRGAQRCAHAKPTPEKPTQRALTYDDQPSALISKKSNSVINSKAPPSSRGAA